MFSRNMTISRNLAIVKFPLLAEIVQSTKTLILIPSDNLIKILKFIHNLLLKVEKHGLERHFQ